MLTANPDKAEAVVLQNSVACGFPGSFGNVDGGINCGNFVFGFGNTALGNTVGNGVIGFGNTAVGFGSGNLVWD